MVLDLRMPRRDGVGVVEHVMERHPKARLLIMTTYDGDEDIFKSLSHGAKGYLLKDAPRQEILTAIRAVAADQPYTSFAIAAKALQRMARPSLTQRELDVLQATGRGAAATRTSGRRLSISEGTAKTHVKPSSPSSMHQSHRGGGGGAQAGTDPVVVLHSVWLPFAEPRLVIESIVDGVNRAAWTSASGG